MFRSPRRSYRGIDIWPGFVDAMATLLMVIIFVLMTFVLAQFYLTDALTNKDENLALLTQQLKDSATHKINLENEKKKAEEKISHLEASVQELTKKIQEIIHSFDTTTNDLTITKQEKSELEVQAAALREATTTFQADIDLLKTQIADYTLKQQELESNLTQQAEKIQSKETELTEKNRALMALTEELTALKEKILGLQNSYDYLTQEHTLLQKENLKFKGSMVAYRSEFFAMLQKTVGARGDVRIVGDRFVFQSEVLFNTGSADLGAEGKQQLNTLAMALKEISEKIPSSLKWVLRVDGHTDQVPISTPSFPSNWELSSARAICVVRYLVSQGISPKNLVAAGFGQFQPLEDSIDIKAQARNRRIEFKLDQR